MFFMVPNVGHFDPKWLYLLNCDIALSPSWISMKDTSMSIA